MDLTLSGHPQIYLKPGGAQGQDESCIFVSPYGHIETVMSEFDIFVSLTGNFNITASDHMKNLKNIAFVGNTEHIQDSPVNSILFYAPEISSTVPVTAFLFVNDRAEQFRRFSFQYVQTVILLEFFVFAFASCIAIFASAVSALKHVDTSFNSIGHGFLPS